MSLQVLCVIPSRLASQRLPCKPLREILGKPMIQRVWERAVQVNSFTRVVVATDSEEIAAAARSFGGEAIMTSSDLKTGTDRVAAVAEMIMPQVGEWDIVVNLQGDMPLIEPAVIDKTVALLADNSQFDITTVATPIVDVEAFNSSTCVKVVLGVDGRALYFSRAPIPCSRDGLRGRIAIGNEELEIYGLKHIGLYVYRPQVLKRFPTFATGNIERIEMLEQLRALENGCVIGVAVVPLAQTRWSVEVDTEADLAAAEKIALKLGL